MSGEMIIGRGPIPLHPIELGSQNRVQERLDHINSMLTNLSNARRPRISETYENMDRVLKERLLKEKSDLESSLGIKG